MPSINKVMLMGNATREVVSRALPSGLLVADFGIAVNRRWRNQDGSFKDETCFVDVTAWGKVAENVQHFVTKGTPIYIEGYLRFDKWQDKQTGQDVSKLRVVAQSVDILNNFNQQPGGDFQSGGFQQPGGFQQGGFQQNSYQQPGGFQQNSYQPQGGFQQQGYQQSYQPNGYQQNSYQQNGFQQSSGFQQNSYQPQASYAPQNGYQQQPQAYSPQGSYQPQQAAPQTYQQSYSNPTAPSAPSVSTAAANPTPMTEAAPAPAPSAQVGPAPVTSDDLVYEATPVKTAPAQPMAAQPPADNPEAKPVVDDTPF